MESLLSLFPKKNRYNAYKELFEGWVLLTLISLLVNQEVYSKLKLSNIFKLEGSEPFSYKPMPLRVKALDAVGALTFGIPLTLVSFCALTVPAFAVTTTLSVITAAAAIVNETVRFALDSISAIFNCLTCRKPEASKLNCNAETCQKVSGSHKNLYGSLGITRESVMQDQVVSSEISATDKSVHNEKAQNETLAIRRKMGLS